LKPSNIFLSPHGVKLLDFGLARPFAASERPGDADLTLPGVVYGTPRYMAPELFQDNPIDTRSDLFVLGVVRYEMLAGSPPLRGSTPFEVARAIMKDEPAALGGSSGIVALDRVIHRALRKRPEDRYQTATAFADDLRRAVVVTETSNLAAVRAMTRLV